MYRKPYYNHNETTLFVRRKRFVVYAIERDRKVETRRIYVSRIHADSLRAYIEANEGLICYVAEIA